MMMSPTPLSARKQRPSIGDPIRMSFPQRTPAVDSDSDQDHTPRSPSSARYTSSAKKRDNQSVGGGRMGMSIRTPNSRGMPSRDPRPIQDRSFMAQCARKVADFLKDTGYPKMINDRALFQGPSTKEFWDIFRFIVTQIDDKLPLEGKCEDEVPLIMRRLKYPVEVNKSKLQAIGAPNTWPHLLAVLDWLVALAEFGRTRLLPSVCGHPDLQSQDPKSAWTYACQKNYMDYIAGIGEFEDREIREHFETRIESFREEMGHVEGECDSAMQRIDELRAQHEHLLDMKALPVQMQADIERVNTCLAGQDGKLQRIAENMSKLEQEERALLEENQGLETQAQDLSEQVDTQVCSKQDIERLISKRSHLNKVLADLKTDSEKAEQKLSELSINESRLAESIRREERLNKSALDAAQRAAPQASLSQVRVNLQDPTDDLHRLCWTDSEEHARDANAELVELTRKEEATVLKQKGEQQVMQEEVVKFEREIQNLCARTEQQERQRDEDRRLFATKLEETRRKAQAAEDEIPQVQKQYICMARSNDEDTEQLRSRLETLAASNAKQKASEEEKIRRGQVQCQEHIAWMHQQLAENVRQREAVRLEVESQVDKNLKSIGAGGG